MGRYRKMLIAVDGSDSSKNAFRQACVVARGEDSWITVLTAIPIYEDQFEVLSTRETIVRTLREEGEKIISEIRKIAEKEDVFIKTRIEEGSPFQTIIDVSEENNYDLIVVGRRGLRRLEKALVGSVTARVIGHSRRNVLVIPRNATLGWKHILLATDGSRFSAAAADKAINVAKSYDSKLKVVSVVDVTEEFYAQAPDAVEEMVYKAKDFVDKIRRKAEAEGVNVQTFVKEGEAYRVINDLAREQKTDVILMGSHGRTGVKRLLMGSVTEKVIGYAPCPVLVVIG